MSQIRIFIAAGAMVAASSFTAFSQTTMDFGPSNPFYATSTLPFHAPPFDRIKDSDYQPAIEAGMAEQLREIEAIANNECPCGHPASAHDSVAARYCEATIDHERVRGVSDEPERR